MIQSARIPHQPALRIDASAMQAMRVELKWPNFIRAGKKIFVTCDSMAVTSLRLQYNQFASEAYFSVQSERCR